MIRPDIIVSSIPCLWLVTFILFIFEFKGLFVKDNSFMLDALPGCLLIVRLSAKQGRRREAHEKPACCQTPDLKLMERERRSRNRNVDCERQRLRVKGEWDDVCSP